MAFNNSYRVAKLYSFEIFFCSVLVIKRGMVIEENKSIPSQVRVLNFSDGSPYETLHAYISAAVAPYFKSYVKESGKDRLGFLVTFYVWESLEIVGGKNCLDKL